jgi:hypothetical protein
MTTEELPPIEFLDMAAKAAGYWDWVDAPSHTGYVRQSIIAHARTLQKLAAHDPSIMPIDPDQECLAAAVRAWGCLEHQRERILAGKLDDTDRAAIAVIRAHCEARVEAAVAKALAARRLGENGNG